MTRPPSLDYATVRPSRLSPPRRRLTIAGSCIAASWLVWVCLVLQSGYTPEIDDPPLVVALVMGVVPATLCGLIVYVIALLGLWSWSVVRRRRRRRAGAS
jgi:hypothetical protein